MNIEKSINDFILLISDPRNISPYEFAEYYPRPGEKWNSKKLNKDEIAKHFGEFRIFKLSDNWNGYVSLEAKIYLLLESYNELSINDKEIYLNYFSLMSRDISLKTQTFISDKILSEKEYYNLLSIYTVFSKTLIELVLNEFKVLQIEATESVDISLSSAKKSIVKKEEGYLYVGSLFAQDLIKSTKDGILYNSNMYSSARNLAEELKCAHQYINDTISAKGSKSIYTRIRYKKTLEYCKNNNIEVSPLFEERYNEFQARKT